MVGKGNKTGVVGGRSRVYVSIHTCMPLHTCMPDDFMGLPGPKQAGS